MLNFASTGSGTANHLAVEMLAKQAGIKVTTVFYKGSMEGHRRRDRRPHARHVRAGVVSHAASKDRQAYRHRGDGRHPDGGCTRSSHDGGSGSSPGTR